MPLPAQRAVLPGFEFAADRAVCFRSLEIFAAFELLVGHREFRSLARCKEKERDESRYHSLYRHWRYDRMSEISYIMERASGVCPGAL